MKLELSVVPPVRGIYGKDKNQMPSRALFLAPDAVEPLMRTIEAIPGLAFSDMFRSAEASLAAVQSKSGVQPPAYSSHNYGLAVDIDVDGTIKRSGMSYIKILEKLEENGWACYRRDKKRGVEDWHQTFVGDKAGEILKGLTATSGGWSRAAERAIQLRYKDQMTLSPKEQQQALAKLGLYRGDADGKLGPLSQQAKAAFCRAWKLPLNDEIKYLRVLSYVSADTAIV